MRPSSRSRTFNALPEEGKGERGIKRGKRERGSISAFGEFLIRREKSQKIGTLENKSFIYILIRTGSDKINSAMSTIVYSVTVYEHWLQLFTPIMKESSGTISNSETLTVSKWRGEVLICSDGIEIRVVKLFPEFWSYQPTDTPPQNQSHKYVYVE